MRFLQSDERGLVERATNDKNRRVFSITEHAREEYFDDNPDRRLNLPED